MTTLADAPAGRARPEVIDDSAARRVVDVVVAALGLLGLSPLLAVLAAAVRLTSRGPVLFRQERVGRGGRLFRILKLRSMVDGPQQGPLVSGTRDPRVTPVGSWLRKTRLDELPQLVNLLRGDLTLVGPRPEVPRFVREYTDDEREMLRVRPGIIGPGALLFAAEQAGELDSSDDPEQHYLQRQMHPRLALDLDYLQHRSVRRDVSLILRSLVVCARHA
ncbi:MAG TPA: sugar transferase [Jatrophihabitans sp.]|nr:sugar transferase [Jatrophihabitans sp.]